MDSSETASMSVDEAIAFELATKILKWKAGKYEDSLVEGFDHWIVGDEVPVVSRWAFRPLEKIEHAMLVFEEIRKTGRYCCLKMSSDYHYVWDVILIEGEQPDDKHEPTIVTTDENLCRAICKAALKVLENQNESSRKSEGNVS